MKRVSPAELKRGHVRVTAERVRQLVRYEPETGRFSWLVNRGPVRVGDMAGTLCNGRWQLFFDGRAYRAGRIAWLYMTGEWPVGEVDHRDEDCLNNRWLNLRDVPPAINLDNRYGPQANNKTSGLRGVSWSAVSGRWVAYINKDRRHFHLGLFDCKFAAQAAYLAAKRVLHPGVVR